MFPKDGSANLWLPNQIPIKHCIYEFATTILVIFDLVKLSFPIFLQYILLESVSDTSLPHISLYQCLGFCFNVAGDIFV